MKMLVLGAGATGGYFGARLVESGADVTFLVRPRRAAQIARDGLVVRSPAGDATLRVRTVGRDDVDADYDVVFLACKAYDLDDAIDTVGAAVGSATAVLPLLNGMRHVERLLAAFGPDRVLGGTCHIAATLSPEGEIAHLNQLERVRFGELDGRMSGRVVELARAFAKTTVDAAASTEIVLEMWEKWALLASLAALTCTMRGSIGDIVACDDGERLILQAIDDCTRIAAAEGQALRAPSLALARKLLTERGSAFTSSMLRDIERGADRIESDHIVGDLLARGRRHGIEPALLVAANVHLQTYLARRARETGG